MDSSQKTKTKTDMTTTPVVPAWVQQPMQDFTSAVSGMMGRDATDFVAPATALQNQAFQGAANLGGWQNNLNSASNLYNQVAGAGPNQIGTTHQAGVSNATAAGILDNGYQQYMNPYLNDVVNTTLAGYDQTAGQQTAAAQAAAAKTGAFGGSRSAIGQAILAAQQGLGRASTEAGLRSNAFNAAMALAGADADRRQQVGLFNAGAQNQANLFNAGALNTTEGLNLGAREADLARQLQAASGLTNVGNAEASNTRGDIALQGTLGGIQREIDQAMATADWSKLQAIGQLYGYANLPMFVGQNQKGKTVSTTSQSGLGSILGSAGQIAGGIGSIANLFAGPTAASLGAGAAAAGLGAGAGAAAGSGLGSALAAFSDERLKKDIKTVRFERGPRGPRRRVSWRYKWQSDDEPRYEGYIAQELQKTDPQAVGMALGYLTVNEAAL